MVRIIRVESFPPPPSPPPPLLLLEESHRLAVVRYRWSLLAFVEEIQLFDCHLWEHLLPLALLWLMFQGDGMLLFLRWCSL